MTGSLRGWLGARVALLATPLGRHGLLLELHRRGVPLLAGLARAYRGTIVRRTRVVAVVGSYGKTTTARAVTLGLGRSLHPRLPLNSPSFVAEAMLRIRPHDRHAVVEAGADRLGQMAFNARLVRPDLVVVTSIGASITAPSRPSRSPAIRRPTWSEPCRQPAWRC